MDEFENGDNHAADRGLPHPKRETPQNLAGNPKEQGETGVGDVPSSEASHRLQALIVDDDKDVTHTFARALRRVGYRCEVANSARDALHKLAYSEPDLVLLDLRIGHEIDGEDILLQIRTNPRLDDSSVIVVSAYPEMTKTLGELADLVMVKPVEVDQLQKLSRRLGSYRREPDKMHISDPLTGLYNRNFFYTRLEQAMERAKRRPDFLFATLVLSVDPADRANGDAENGVSKSLLSQAAQRLRPSLRPTDTIAFLFSRTFATLLEDLRRPEDTQVVIDRIEKTLTQPYQIQDQTILPQISLGAVIHDRRYQSTTELLDLTEETMKMARQAGNRHLIVPAYGSAPLEDMAPYN